MFVIVPPVASHEVAGGPVLCTPHVGEAGTGRVLCSEALPPVSTAGVLGLVFVASCLVGLLVGATLIRRSEAARVRLHGGRR